MADQRSRENADTDETGGDVPYRWPAPRPAAGKHASDAPPVESKPLNIFETVMVVGSPDVDPGDPKIRARYKAWEKAHRAWKDGGRVGPEPPPPDLGIEVRRARLDTDDGGDESAERLPDARAEYVPPTTQAPQPTDHKTFEMDTVKVTPGLNPRDVVTSPRLGVLDESPVLPLSTAATAVAPRPGTRRSGLLAIAAVGVAAMSFAIVIFALRPAPRVSDAEQKPVAAATMGAPWPTLQPNASEVPIPPASAEPATSDAPAETSADVSSPKKPTASPHAPSQAAKARTAPARPSSNPSPSVTPTAPPSSSIPSGRIND